MKNKKRKDPQGLRFRGGGTHQKIQENATPGCGLQVAFLAQPATCNLQLAVVFTFA